MKRRLFAVRPCAQAGKAIVAAARGFPTTICSALENERVLENFPVFKIEETRFSAGQSSQEEWMVTATAFLACVGKRPDHPPRDA